MQDFTVTGVRQGDFVPQLVSSEEANTGGNLLNVIFETNPLGESCTIDIIVDFI